MSDSYEERRERRREEERAFERNVAYDVWRSGGDPDRINYERVRDSFDNGRDSDSAVRREMNAQRPKPQEQEPEWPTEQFPT